jgi:hypothetical protein
MLDLGQIQPDAARSPLRNRPAAAKHTGKNLKGGLVNDNKLTHQIDEGVAAVSAPR